MSRSIKERGVSPSKSEDWAQPIERENLSDRAYLSIRSALMRGQLKPGERMLLRPMSERFGISMTPMREALLRLVFERAMVLDGRGTVIVPELTLSQLLEIRSIRVDLEGNTAAAAATLASEEEISKLEDIQEKISACHARKNFDDAINLNTEFHLTLCRAGRMPITYDLVEGLWARCGPILSHLYDGGVPEDWVPHPHTRIIEALRHKDAEAARAGIRFDIEAGGKGLIDYVKNH
ncbi:GntR family transcriptional regulator [Paracoccus alkanivorans]|uniref:GntR family transcriptional regulator n=1 Tax=Paracoccus alkanivorans TaxID=2116655 RepID=A0A3M0MDC4_9RHOB|nr:GntR family transcriptional regulator [Paracoccus alkanivorans]RMC35631.1 GntR family transcriptional regulator [Paracoccus alkanivorans]